MSNRKRRSNRSGRRALRSPGRPPVSRRENRRLFWTAIAAGLTSERAAIVAGVSPPLEFGGSVRTAACHQRYSLNRQSRCAGAICLFRSAKRLRSCWLRGTAYARSLVDWAVQPRRSHGNFDVTPPRAAAVSFIAPQRRNGMPKGLLAVRSRQRWRSMLH